MSFVDPIFACDFYKTGHKDMYPAGTNLIYSNFTPRSNKHCPYGADKVVFFGLQGFILQWLVENFNEGFFKQPKEKVLAKYKRRMETSIGGEFNTDHIAALHDLGYLPIEIKALPEGSLVGMKVPVLTVKNTLPDFFWVTNYLETLLSNELWKPTTTATTAYEYRKVLTKWAEKTGSPIDFVDWQAHDFSLRGMSGMNDSASSAGHLVSFLGTDTIPAIDYLEKYYSGLDTFVGGSVPASEHSCMTANILKIEEMLECGILNDDIYSEYVNQTDIQNPSNREVAEYATIKQLLNKFDTGVVSIVSDSFDFWSVITNIASALKPVIMNRKENAIGLAKTVFRPDCYADGTKILTKSGWVDFKDIDDSTYVAQVNDDGTYEFVIPQKITKQYYHGDMVRFFDAKRKFDFTVTPNHRMISYIDGKESIDLAENLKVGNNHKRKFKRSAYAKSCCDKRLTPLERLKIAFQADGAFCTGTDNAIRFNFSKKRKIDRLKNILDMGNIKYSEYFLKDSRVEINVKINASIFSKKFDWIDTKDLTKEWCQDFIEELSYWDACRRNANRFKYDSTNFEVIPVIELICMGAGYGCLISKYHDDRKEHFSDVYTCNILTDSEIGSQALRKEIVNYDGMVYCVTVPSGKILVKNNDSTLVCGNSGDPADVLCGIDYHIIEDEFFAEEIAARILLGKAQDDAENLTPDESGQELYSDIFKVGDKFYECEIHVFWDSLEGQYPFIESHTVTCWREIKLTPEEKGAVECLWDIFGGTYTDTGYRVLDSHVGLIYGDSITVKLADEIMKRLEKKGFASCNVVFGVGSYTYQYSTRDTFGFAVKCTYAEVNGIGIDVFKDPKTDSGKKSAKGLLRVEYENGEYVLHDQQTPEQELTGCLETVFIDGKLVNPTTIVDIRERLKTH